MRQHLVWLDVVVEVLELELPLWRSLRQVVPLCLLVEEEVRLLVALDVTHPNSPPSLCCLHAG